MTVEGIRKALISFSSTEKAPLDSLIEEAGEKRVLLLGEATHGTSEFYRMRAELSKKLITSGFRLFCLEADWPDAALIDDYICWGDQEKREKAFKRFPLWMWNNKEFFSWVEWLRGYNRGRKKSEQVRLFGLDMYSLYRSIEAVLWHLSKLNPDLAQRALEHYSCLSPWKEEPSEYGLAASLQHKGDCEEEVLSVLQALLEERLDHQLTEEEYFDAVQNAKIVAEAERYYRTMYRSSIASWNLRDSHMFETLQALLDHFGPSSRAVVWAHNSHVGDAYATEMGRRGEFNIGALCKKEFKREAFSIGFGTYGGEVAAADHWEGRMRVKTIRPALQESCEHVFHQVEEESFYVSLGGAFRTFPFGV